MRSARYYTVDVFTDVPFGGNQLAVFPDARGIAEALLLPLTREFNYSETTFVYPPTDPQNTRRVRIFTPGGELPFAGHPTVGTAHVLAAIGDVALTGDLTRIVLEEGVGPVPVSIRARDGRPVFAELSAAKMPEVVAPAPSREAMAEVLGIDVDDLRSGEWSPAIMSCGIPFLFVPVASVDALSRARIRLDAWERTVGGTPGKDVFVFTSADDGGTQYRARMFAPGIGVPEDPATGSACAALSGYLAARDPRRDGTFRWTVRQGVEMGRPSRIEVEADLRDDAVCAVRVGGASVMMCEGMIPVR